MLISNIVLHYFNCCPFKENGELVRKRKKQPKPDISSPK